MQTMNRFIAFSCMFASSFLTTGLQAADTIYQSTDKRGNPVFTDQPKPDARPVELKPTNTTPSLAPFTPLDPSPPEVVAYTSVGIGVPTSIPNGLAPTSIGIELQPALQPGHRWQLMLDGAIQEEGSDSSVTIERLERGPHQLELRVLDAQGQIMGSSTREVFVYWPGGKNQ
jgi:hypothetical protein